MVDHDVAKARLVGGDGQRVTVIDDRACRGIAGTEAQMLDQNVNARLALDVAALDLPRPVAVA